MTADQLRQLVAEAGFEQVMKHKDGSTTVLPDALFERFAALVLTNASQAPAEEHQRVWAGPIAFIQQVQNVSGAPGNWGDEFLAWYRPDEWFGEHRAAAVFVGAKLAGLSAQRTLDKHLTKEAHSWMSGAAQSCPETAPDVQPKGTEPVAEVRATGANSCELFFLPAGIDLKPGDKLYAGPAQAPAPAHADLALMPRKATPEMMRAAVVYANGNAVYKNVAAEALAIEESIYGEVWDAMLAAAPAIPAPESGAPEAQQDGWNEPYNCIAAGPTATDVALHQAMNEAAKVGNRDDDKLIRKALNDAGYYLVRSMKKPGTCEHLLAAPCAAVAHERCESCDYTEGWEEGNKAAKAELSGFGWSAVLWSKARGSAMFASRPCDIESNAEGCAAEWRKAYDPALFDVTVSPVFIKLPASSDVPVQGSDRG